jgi:hypothetical protein
MNSVLDIRFIENDQPLNSWLCISAGASPMIKAACGCHPSKWDGRVAGDVVDELTRAVDSLFEHPEQYEIWEPVLHAVTVKDVQSFIDEMRTICKLHPKARIEVSY